MSDLDNWLTSEEACSRLAIAWRTLYNHHRNTPDFPQPRRVGRTLLWPADQLDTWRANHPSRKPKSHES